MPLLKRALLLSMSLAAPQAQPAAPGGLIVGQVVDAGSGRPVPNAIVTISGLPGAQMVPTMDASGRLMAGGPPRVLTGTDGRFVFRNLPRGSFGLSATRTGYSPAAYGMRRPAGPSRQITLTDGERLGDVTIRMWRQGSISGRIVDEADEPLVGLRVRIFTHGALPDPHRLATVATATTDDRGMYRFGMLDAREYVVGVVSRTTVVPTAVAQQVRGNFNPVFGELGVNSLSDSANGVQVGDSVVVLSPGAPLPVLRATDAMMVYPPAFYPSTPDSAQAMAISVAPGEEREGIDIQIRPVKTVRVTGTLSGSVADLGMVPIRLIPASGVDVVIDSDLPGTVTVADRTGRFAFEAVPTGEYLLRASTRLRFVQSPVDDVQYVEMPITVGPTNIEGISLTLHPGLRISGSFQFEGSTRVPTALSAVSLTIDPAGGSLAAPLPPSNPRPTNTGEFEAGGLPPGRYYVRVTNSPPGWMFKSATLNGRDVADTAIDLRNGDAAGIVITFSDRWSGLSGTVQTASGAPDPDALIIVFPTDTDTWHSAGFNPRRIKSVRSSANGQYNFQTLPPGDYYVAAVPDRQAADWRDAGFLELAARIGRQVSIGDGERKTLDVRTREIR